MTSTNNTSNNNIVAIQLKLFDCNDFEQNLNEKTHCVKKVENQDKRIIMSDTDKYEYINPSCPYCNSLNIVKEGNRPRIVNLPFKYKHEILLKKYRCKECGKYFQTEVKSLVEKYKNYSVDFKDTTEELLKKMVMYLLEKLLKIIQSIGIVVHLIKL